MQQQLGIRAVYDLAATPLFLRGSGYDEGTLFPWVGSDFSLVDAIDIADRATLGLFKQRNRAR